MPTNLPSDTIFDEVNGQKKVIDDKLIDIGLHAKALSEYMIAVGYSEWEKMSCLFHMAHGIKDLDYDGITYDDSFFLCRPASEYEKAKQLLYKRLVKEITFFTFLYSGLEAVITSLHLKDVHVRKGR